MVAMKSIFPKSLQGAAAVRQGQGRVLAGDEPAVRLVGLPAQDGFAEFLENADSERDERYFHGTPSSRWAVTCG